MKHKVADLEGALLDEAVAKALGLEYAKDMLPVPTPIVRVWVKRDHFRPSEDWSEAGPIIERERITVQASRAGDWRAWVGDGDSQPAPEGRADTPLIAAMRAYVASKFGDEIELV